MIAIKETVLSDISLNKRLISKESIGRLAGKQGQDSISFPSSIVYRF